MNKSKTLAFITALFAMQSSEVLAHSGHGEWAAFAHSYEHAIWMLGGVVVTGLLVMLGRKLSRRRARVLNK